MMKTVAICFLLMFQGIGISSDTDGQKTEHLIVPSGIGGNRDNGPGSIIKRFIDSLLSPGFQKGKGNPNGDQEHGDSIAPLLMIGKPVYLYRSSLSLKGHPEPNFVMENGRLFVDFESPYDQSRIPVLKIRPIDGGSHIPFLVRIQLIPRAPWPEVGFIEINVRFPSIFSPRLTINRATLGFRKVPFKISTGEGMGATGISIAITRKDGEAFRKDPKGSLLFLVDGEIELNAYEPLPKDRYVKSRKWEAEGRLAGIARLIAGRDYRGAEDPQRIAQLARDVAGIDVDAYEAVRKVNRYVQSAIRYFPNNLGLTAMQILDEGSGDCDDFSRLMVSLLRALGIPSRLALGSLYDFDKFGSHAWVETALPLKKGGWHWFICDPTLASVSSNKDMLVEFKHRMYIYPVKFDVQYVNIPADSSEDIMLNWMTDVRKALSPQAQQSIVQELRLDLDRRLQLGVDSLRSLNFPVKREFRFTQGSPYILLDRPLSAYVSFPVAGSGIDHSRWRVKLDKDDNLLLEVGVTDEDFDLESAGDVEFIDRLRAVRLEIRRSLLGGVESQHLMDMTYLRDPHTDRLQKVTVALSWYLVERHVGEIIDTMAAFQLCSNDEASALKNLFMSCQGKNFYYLLEKVRDVQ